MEITIGTIIKIILGLLVAGAVIYGIYVFFGDYVIDFSKNVGINTTVKLFMSLF